MPPRAPSPPSPPPPPSSPPPPTSATLRHRHRCPHHPHPRRLACVRASKRHAPLFLSSTRALLPCRPDGTLHLALAADASFRLRRHRRTPPSLPHAPPARPSCLTAPPTPSPSAVLYLPLPPNVPPTAPSPELHREFNLMSLHFHLTPPPPPIVGGSRAAHPPTTPLHLGRLAAGTRRGVGAPPYTSGLVSQLALPGALRSASSLGEPRSSCSSRHPPPRA